MKKVSLWLEWMRIDDHCRKEGNPKKKNKKISFAELDAFLIYLTAFVFWLAGERRGGFSTVLDILDILLVNANPKYPISVYSISDPVQRVGHCANTE